MIHYLIKEKQMFQSFLFKFQCRPLISEFHSHMLIKLGVKLRLDFEAVLLFQNIMYEEMVNLKENIYHFRLKNIKMYKNCP